VIGVLTADCGPVLFADAQAGVIGAAHAGWRGAFDGVLENTVEAMQQLARAHPASPPCWAHRSARPITRSDPEFVDRFIARDATHDDLLQASDKTGAIPCLTSGS
jgi:copper oxidase (laccase) domain-containing protein